MVPDPLTSRSRLSEHRVDQPAAPHVLAGLAAVTQDLGRVPTRVLQGIPQEWHAFKGPFCVDGAGKRDDRGGQSNWARRRWAERVAGDVAQQGGLIALLLRPEFFLLRPAFLL